MKDRGEEAQIQMDILKEFKEAMLKEVNQKQGIVYWILSA